MQLQELLADDDAVSPVIGVILMVAITVILAAVIGTFVLGLGGNVNENPQVTWEFAQNNSNVDVTHNGGDSVEAANIGYAGAANVTIGTTDFSGTITAGDRDVNVSTTSGETFRIVYDNPENDQTSVIGTYEVP